MQKNSKVDPVITDNIITGDNFRVGKDIQTPECYNPVFTYIEVGKCVRLSNFFFCIFKIFSKILL